jgi:MFS family permease
LRLEQLGFSPSQIGWCCATQAIGSLIAPLVAGQIADRWLAAEKCLAFGAVVAAGVLWLLASLTTPGAVFAASLLFWLVMAPSLTLCASIGFSHLKDPAREFGRVRMWGTVGWVAPSWLMGLWLAESDAWSPVKAWLGQPNAELADAFHFAAILAILFGLYALTLPHTPPRKTQGAAPLAAIRALRSRSFFVYAFCTFGICVALPFHTQVSPLLLENLNVPAAWIPPLLTIAQGSEMLSLFALPAVYSRIGARATMRLGLLAAVLTLTGLMLGSPLGVVIAGLSLYGFCISFYLVVGQMFLNQRSPEGVRSSAQALHSSLCGIGLLVGNVLIGEVRTIFGERFAPTYAVAAGLAAVLFVVFMVGFPRAESPASRTSS